MTGSAFFGIRAMTIVSYISVPLIAMLGITAMIRRSDREMPPLLKNLRKARGLASSPAREWLSVPLSAAVRQPRILPDLQRRRKRLSGPLRLPFSGNSLMFCFGAFIGVYVGGNDIFEVMIALNLTVFAIIVLGLNIWTTNDNALYSAGLGLSNITKIKKSPLVLISGALGTVAAIWLYNNFTGWLNILNCTLPPVGAILILGYFCHKEDYDQDKENTLEVNWFAIAGVILGAVVANVVPVGIASINGMAVAVVCYLVGFAAGRKK